LGCGVASVGCAVSAASVVLRGVRASAGEAERASGDIRLRTIATWVNVT